MENPSKEDEQKPSEKEDDQKVESEAAPNDVMAAFLSKSKEL